MAYEIQLTPQAARQYNKLPKPQRRSIKACIDSLADDPRPHGCQSLRGYPYYRVHAGDYRIIYGIEDNQLLVTVVLLGNRRDVYRALKNL